MRKSSPQKLTIYTVGHSNRPIKEFLRILNAHGIKRIVDVRTIPKSRHNPQFGEARLKNSLRKAGIKYSHESLLGGLRHTRKDSKNTGWENLSFRGFADYMQTDDFKKGLSKLEKLAAHSKTAMMCAEAVPWRCHRSLIADAVKKSGAQAFHIMSATSAKEHKYTSFMRIHKGQIAYPAPAGAGKKRRIGR